MMRNGERDSGLCPAGSAGAREILETASQDVSDAGRVPGATTGSCYPLSIQPISDFAQRLCSGSLNLLNEGNHLDRAGIGGLPNLLDRSLSGVLKARITKLDPAHLCRSERGARSSSNQRALPFR